MTWFRALPLLWRIVTILGIVAALGGSAWGLYAYVKHQGYVDGYADATARCEAEKKAMEAANKQAVADAAKELFRAADALSLRSLELDDALKAIDEATAADPLGGTQCLDARGLRALNSIR